MPSRKEIPGPAKKNKEVLVIARRALERSRGLNKKMEREEMDAELDLLDPSLHEKEQREAKLQGMVKELVDESGVRMPESKSEEKSKGETRKEMEDLEKEWAERIKRDIDATETKTAELKEKRAVPIEQKEKMARAKAGERIKAGVQAERASAETDPARKRAIAKLKKLEAEHEETGKRLRDLTGMEPEDAYEKLVLNGGFMARIKRGLAELANVPTYKLLDSWVESGKKLEEVDREVVGTKPDIGHVQKAKGLSGRANEEMETKSAIGRDDARIYRKKNEMKPLDTSESVGEISDKTLMEDVNALKTKEFNAVIEQSRVEAVAKAKAEAQKLSVESDALLKFQKEHAQDINVVRAEYPRAAEIWNSIAGKLQGLDSGAKKQLEQLFKTGDIATAYVLDRAFSDMGEKDEQAKARIQKADTILGIEEVSPKGKVRPKRVRPEALKKAA